MPTVHSERLNADLHLGKQPPKPIADAIEYRTLKWAIASAGISFPPLPAHFGGGGDFPGNRWLMLGNGPDDTVHPGFQGCGDCAWAGPAHEEMEAARGAGRPIPHFTGKTIVAQYSAYSGYDPQTGQNDNGSAIADVIQWRQTKGLLDDAGHAYRIGQAIHLTPGDIQQLWEAVYLFENAGIGLVICQAQMGQFDARQRWDHVPGSPEEGGHYAPVVGRASLDDSGLITWGERHGFTRSFYQAQNDETVVYLDPERYNAVTGLTAEHHTEQDLERYLAALPAFKAAG
ncbi:MAG: hypothetical protein LC685_04420 [Actinobacteria bacterium]|nr:hypothetical protein [Actinomycetota bacterium]